MAKVGTSKAGGTISKQAAVHPWLAADAHGNKQKNKQTRVINPIPPTASTHAEEATNIVWIGLATMALCAIKINSVCSWKQAQCVTTYDTP
jgi:hypothetical protein